MKYEVLIIDDDKILCMVINKVIESSNLPSAYIFNKANSALGYIAERNTSDHNFLILLDINMPIMNGWEFLTALNSQTLNAKVHVSIITSSIDQNDRKKANEFDCVFDFLVKPIKSMDMVKFSKLPFLKPFFFNQ